jgi:hypothetical protein
VSEHEGPTTDVVEDYARGTLQEWFGGYVPAEDGAPIGQYRVVRVGERGAADLYQFEPVEEHGVQRGTGRVFRVQVVVEAEQ